MHKGLSRRTLRSMQKRWQQDLDRLEDAYGPMIPFRENNDPTTETQRNLATAIAEIKVMLGSTDRGLRDAPNGGEVR